MTDIIKRYQAGERDFRGASLSGADLHGVNLRGANLRGSDLYGANLYGADLYGANLCQTNLYGANLCDTDLSYVNLIDGNLSCATLSGATLHCAGLSDANLRGATLSDAQLSSARGVTYASATWSGHGECGRQLLAIADQDGPGQDIYHCGCFRGSWDDLMAYITTGEEFYRASRTLTAETVAMLLAAAKRESP